MPGDLPPIRGRGASDNPPNRFEPSWHEYDLESESETSDDLSHGPDPATQLFRDSSRSIITTNDSPDVGFDASINPYRGCEHGCIYCYARPTHEYLGFSAGLDFESKIVVKEDAPALLRSELAAPGWRPKPLAISGVTDPYQPWERRLRLTRGCLEVLAEFRNPVVVITKNALVTRDLDLLQELAEHQAALVFLSVTTLDGALARRLEPRTTSPLGRLQAISTLVEGDVPVGVLVAPVIPGLNDHEIPAILASVAEAGASFASYTLVRLPGAVGPLFTRWLDQHTPERKEKILRRIRSLHAGRLNDPRFGKRMRGEGPFAALIEQLFATGIRATGLNRKAPSLSTSAFQRPGQAPRQLQFFD
jgi:DNA repair photolyase